MPKINAEDLAKIKKRIRNSTVLREGAGRARVTVHMGTCGIASGSKEILTALRKEIKKKGAEEVLVTTSGCAGYCSREPMATVEILGSPPVKYADLTKERIREILNRHVIGGEVVTEYALAVGSERMF
jgi:NADP-reducing hydrogenase subunit HndB